MTVEMVLLSSYSLILLGTAQGLRALGRRSTSPWASRTLAGHLRATGQAPDHPGADDWPHSEVPRLYRVMSVVAILAALALSGGGLLLHHRGAGVSVFAALLALSALSLVRAVLTPRRPSKGCASQSTSRGTLPATDSATRMRR
jgi:hypothetical protein